jgi:hypothetical protein
MKNYEGKLVGILGAVIIHLIAAIIFMFFQMRDLKTDHKDEFVIEFQPVKEDEEAEKPIQLPVSLIERILQGNDEYLNIAKNLANKPSVEIDASDYIDKVKEELIMSGQLGKDNYIDEQKKMKETGDDENISIEKPQEAEADKKPETSQEMAANYQGPTRIYYNLPGRNHSYLPIPIYKCEGSGKVVLSIQVNRKGIVEKAEIIGNQSTTPDECLLETAVSTARISRFNADINSPELQQGTITYEFVAQ